jgi:hypothetical protein
VRTRRRGTWVLGSFGFGRLVALCSSPTSALTAYRGLIPPSIFRGGERVEHNARPRSQARRSASPAIRRRHPARALLVARPPVRLLSRRRTRRVALRRPRERAQVHACPIRFLGTGFDGTRTAKNVRTHSNTALVPTGGLARALRSRAQPAAHRHVGPAKETDKMCRRRPIMITCIHLDRLARTSQRLTRRPTDQLR